MINFEVYFTGYGFIERPKVFVLPSSYFYDSTQSKSYNDASVDINYQLHYGVDSYEIAPSHNKIFSMGGGEFSDTEGHYWKTPTSFFDARPHDSINGTLATEENNDMAPLELHFKTKGDIPSGTYSVHFVLTYFDGIRWRNDEKTESFSVRTWTDRNWLEILISTFALNIISVIIGAIPFFLKKKKANEQLKTILISQNKILENLQNEISKNFHHEKSIDASQKPNSSKNNKPKGKGH